MLSHFSCSSIIVSASHMVKVNIVTQKCKIDLMIWREGNNSKSLIQQCFPIRVKGWGGIPHQWGMGNFARAGMFYQLVGI